MKFKGNVIVVIIAFCWMTVALAGIHFGVGWCANAQDSKDEVMKLAEQGNAKAQNSLGVMYSNGEGVPQNYKEAMKWLFKSPKPKK